jgi:hypothetical protein
MDDRRPERSTFGFVIMTVPDRRRLAGPIEALEEGYCGGVVALCQNRA